MKIFNLTVSYNGDAKTWEEIRNDAENEKIKHVFIGKKEFVNIIRCKDCKNWDTTWQNDWAKNYHYCPLVDGTRNGDWFCADGEKK